MTWPELPLMHQRVAPRLGDEADAAYDTTSDDDSDYGVFKDDEDDTTVSSASSWDSEMDELETFVSTLQLRTHSTPALSHMVKKTLNTPENLFARMRKCESLVFNSSQRAPPASPLKPKKKKVSDGTTNDAVSKFKDTKPQDYLAETLKSSGLSFDMVAVDDKSFLPITPENVKAYNITAQAAREENLAALDKFHKDGVSLQGCNNYGESIVHIVCRRGSSSIFQYLLNQAKVSMRVRDDFGRTPLHDAAWTDKPNFELVHQLLLDSPDFLFAKDKRGHLALSYVPHQRWAEWCLFLEMHPEHVQAAIESPHTFSGPEVGYL